jgi:hypothetical protein
MWIVLWIALWDCGSGISAVCEQRLHPEGGGDLEALGNRGCTGGTHEIKAPTDTGGR